MKDTLKEVLFSMIPLSIVIIILMIFFGGFSEISIFTTLLGMVLSIMGFTLFLIGVRSGLLLMGESIGVALMQSRKLWLMIGVFIAIGFSITFAEPGVMILSRQVDAVSEGAVGWFLLVFVIAVGVGMFMGLALLRTLFGLNIKLLLMGSYALIIGLSFFTSPMFLPLSFDASGVTTGPLTVPFILSLGIGMNSVRDHQKSVDSFGFVALASIGPIIGVMLIGVFAS